MLDSAQGKRSGHSRTSIESVCCLLVILGLHLQATYIYIFLNDISQSDKLNIIPSEVDKHLCST